MGLFSNITLAGFIRFFFMRAVEGLVLILILLFLPNIPPFCKFETSYKVPTHLPLEGTLAINDKLSDVQFWHHKNLKGPEAFASFNGELYTSLQTGEIVKLTGEKHISPIVKFGKPCKYYEEDICGRPLGLSFDKAGALYAADAYYGIYKVDVKTGSKVQLVSPDVEINGKKPKLFNNLAVSSTGEIYWTDSSTEFALKDGLFTAFADGSGRVIKYDPKTKRNTVLLDNVYFPNGIILSKNEDYLIISESFRSLLLKYYLKGAKIGQDEVFIEGLPGTPDNIQSDGYDGILVALITTHDGNFPSIYQIFGPFPWMRKLIGRILGLVELGFQIVDRIYPNEIAKVGMYMVGHFNISMKFLSFNLRSTVVHISESGVILDSFHTKNGKVFSIGEAFIHNDQLLLGSPFNEYIGRIPLSKLGLKSFPVEPRVQPTQASKPTTTQKPRTTTPKPITTTTPKSTTTTIPRPTTTTTPRPTTTTTPRPTSTTTPKSTSTTTPKSTSTTTTKATTTTTPKTTTTTTPKTTPTTTPKTTTTTTRKPIITTTTSKPAVTTATKTSATAKLEQNREAPTTPKTDQVPKVTSTTAKPTPKASDTPKAQEKPAEKSTQKLAQKPSQKNEL